MNVLKTSFVSAFFAFSVLFALSAQAKETDYKSDADRILESAVFKPMAEEIETLLKKTESVEKSEFSEKEKKAAQILPTAIERADYFVKVKSNHLEAARKLSQQIRPYLSKPIGLGLTERGASDELELRVFTAAHEALVKAQEQLNTHPRQTAVAQKTAGTWAFILETFKTDHATVIETQANQDLDRLQQSLSQSTLTKK